MLRRKVIIGLSISVIGLLCLSTFMTAASEDTRVADAAMRGDKDAVKSLLKQAVDVNASQGDGMTALHWAAMKGDVDTAQMLLYAGANVKAATRLGGYTALFMASESGNAGVVELLLKAGADPKAKGTDGLTPLMMAAVSGDPGSVKALVEHGADPNAKENDHGQTPLGFAAAFDRADAIKVLLTHGADANLASKTIAPAPVLRDPTQAAAPLPAAPAAGAAPAAPATPAAGGRGGRGAAAAAAPAAPGAPTTPATPAVATAAGAAAAAAAAGNGADGSTRGGGNPKGGLTPLMYAARQGSMNATHALVDGGANVNEGSGDKSTALLLATINGHFDIAKYLVEHKADVMLASMDGATALYGVVNTQWARKSFHPQPTPRYETTTYLDLMSLLLDHGANPNLRLTKELWYSEYNFALESASAAGTTPFWKCAEVGDIDGMRLLVSRGADPNLPSNDGVTPLLMASGAGVHGNDDISAPVGRLAAVKYLVEELHADVNSADTGGNSRVGANAGQDMQQAATPTPAVPGAAPAPAAAAAAAAAQQGPARGAGGGFTALHNAAARGDNAMILYLISKGAKADAMSKSGVSIVDMANGPRQRIQPYPETVALLEMLGSKNSHKCVSC